MGLETRERGGDYYYRKVRDDGRVRSVYLGSGHLAREFDQAVRLARKEAKRRKETPIEEPRAAEIAAQVEAYCGGVTAILRGHLEAHGYHRHKRGEWRKRR